jgi:hypothetical protein
MAVELKIGDYVAGKKFASLEHDFKGEIEKVYENSVLILIKEFQKLTNQLLTSITTAQLFVRMMLSLLKRRQSRKLSQKKKTKNL